MALMSQIFVVSVTTNLHEILAPGLKLILPAALFYKNFILTNRSRVNDAPILAPKQQKKAILDKVTFGALPPI